MITDNKVTEMLEEGVSDCAGTIEELQELVNLFCDCTYKGYRKLVADWKEDYETA